MSPASVAAMGVLDGRRAFLRQGDRVGAQVVAWTELRERRQWLPEERDQRLYLFACEQSFRAAVEGRRRAAKRDRVDDLSDWAT